MTAKPVLPVGVISWRDLTVPNADEVRDFYHAVVGWKVRIEDMGGYNDYTMLLPDTGQAIGGICHARGPNADIPPQWLIYIAVENVEQSAAKCREKGGTVLVPPRKLGGGHFCVIRDPAGAVCALFQEMTK